MKPSSAKDKGRKLQQYVRDSVIEVFTGLSTRDVSSAPSGVNGVDVPLSEAAFQRFPFNVECKSIASFAGYKMYDQAQEHTRKQGEGMSLVVVKMNERQPLVMLSFEDFMSILQTKEEQETPIKLERNTDA